MKKIRKRKALNVKRLEEQLKTDRELSKKMDEETLHTEAFVQLKAQGKKKITEKDLQQKIKEMRGKTK